MIRENPAGTRPCRWPPCFPLCSAFWGTPFSMRRKFLFPSPSLPRRFGEKQKASFLLFHTSVYSRAPLAKELLRTAASFRRRPIRSVKPRKKSPCTARIQGLVRKFKQSDVLPRRAAHAIKSKMPAFCGTMKFSCTLYRLPGNLSTVFRAPRKNFTVSRSSL